MPSCAIWPGGATASMLIWTTAHKGSAKPASYGGMPESPCKDNSCGQCSFDTTTTAKPCNVAQHVRGAHLHVLCGTHATTLFASSSSHATGDSISTHRPPCFVAYGFAFQWDASNARGGEPNRCTAGAILQWGEWIVVDHALLYQRTALSVGDSCTHGHHTWHSFCPPQNKPAMAWPCHKARARNRHREQAQSLKLQKHVTSTSPINGGRGLYNQHTRRRSAMRSHADVGTCTREQPTSTAVAGQHRFSAAWWRWSFVSL